MANVAVPDYQYWKRQIKCQNACPVHTDARGYVRAIAAGDFEKAYLIARGPNPLASICGRVCAAPCEKDCRRGAVDESISIRALKRSASEYHGAELRRTSEIIGRIQLSLKSRKCSDIDELGALSKAISEGVVSPAKGKSVGIIGSGPAGLAAGHDLALLGVDATIYEMEPVAAGMLYLGVPEYRLPREIISKEVEVIKSLGVKIRTGVEVGKDVKFSELRERHDAVIVAVGAKHSRKAPLKGADSEGVLGGVEFLRDMALGNKIAIGEKVVVIGGGNVAYDVSRSALRRIQMDVAEEAVLAKKGGFAVHVVCLEKLEDMPADEIEIIEGREEGIQLLAGYGPDEIVSRDGKVSGVVFKKVVSIFDKNGRFNPSYDVNDKVTIEADTVYWAIGQYSNVSFIDPEKDGIIFTERKLPKVDLETLRTSAPDVFVAGDLALGPRVMIDAIANGKLAARSVYGYLTGRKINFDHAENHAPISDYKREAGYENIFRNEPRAKPVSDRISSQKAEVEHCFSMETAEREASRCFDCGVNTIFDGNRCILCGGCADVCPEKCLELVDFSKVSVDKHPEFRDLMRGKKGGDACSAIIKDERKCIRCGLCAERCPVDAITMERFCFSEKIV